MVSGARVFLLAILMSLFLSTSTTEAHGRAVYSRRPARRVITVVRVVPKKQWLRVIRNVSDVKHAVGDLRSAHAKSLQSLQTVREDLKEIEEQMRLQQTMFVAMFGMVALLLVAVLPAVRVSIVADMLRTLGRKELAKKEEHEAVAKWLEEFTAAPAESVIVTLAIEKESDPKTIEKPLDEHQEPASEKEPDEEAVVVAPMVMLPPLVELIPLTVVPPSEIDLPPPPPDVETTPQPPNKKLCDLLPQQTEKPTIPTWINDMEWEMGEFDWDLDMLMGEVDSKKRDFQS